MARESNEEAVGTWLTTRDAMIQSLTKKLLKAQQRMKEIMDKQRREVQFTKGDWVLVKLRPCRQSTASGGQYSKLAKRFYDPFQIVQRIGPVAYKLDLPSTSRIHPVFHWSLLRPYHSSLTTTETPIPLPNADEDNQPLLTPLTILDKSGTVQGMTSSYSFWSNGMFSYRRIPLGSPGRY